MSPLRIAQLQLAASMALVGVNVGVAKLLAEALPVAMVAGLRCLVAVAVLWPLARRLEGLPHPDAPARRNLFWQALLGTALYNAALLLGLRLTGALAGGLVLSTLPAAMALGAALWLGERLALRHWLAAGLAGLGVAAVALARAPAGGAAAGFGGEALLLLAVCGEAAYALLAKRLAGRVPVFTAALWMQGFSALLLLPFWLPGAGSVRALADPVLLRLLLFHALTASVLCLVLWYSGLRRVPAAVAGVFTALLPVAAAATAVLLLGEHANGAHAVGLVLVLGSVALATWPGRRERTALLQEK